MKEPHIIVNAKTGKRLTASGKILVRWSEFERWMEQYHHIPAQESYTPALDVDRLVEEVVTELTA